MNITELRNLTLSFRTYSNQGKLIRLIYSNHSIIIQIIDGYINIELKERDVLKFNQILINDGQWHDIYFSTDLLRLDHVFSDKIISPKQIYSHNLSQLIIGPDFDGCLGNLTINNQLINLQQNKFIDFIGTNNGCQLPEIIQEYPNTDDFCSLYHPCYHGGICINDELNFTCNCPKPRFTGRQCQIDLYPCESSPCQFNEQCSNSNISFTCISKFVPLSISKIKSFYIGLSIVSGICVLFILIIYYCKKRKEKFIQEKPIVSAPLLIHKSSPITNRMETLHNEKRTIETRLLGDRNSVLKHFNDRVR